VNNQTCRYCENPENILEKDTCCSGCSKIFDPYPIKSKTALHDEIDRMNHLICKVERLNEICEDNMKRLNAMMLELKGIVAMVRPMAKKNDWYGDEIQIKKEDDIQLLN
jgi:hypothetical protein